MGYNPSWLAIRSVVYASRYATLAAAAAAAIAAGEPLVVDIVVGLPTGSLSLASVSGIYVPPNCGFSDAAGACTLSLPTNFNAGAYQIFNFTNGTTVSFPNAGAFNFAPPPETWVEWWGAAPTASAATNDTAIDTAIISCGCPFIGPGFFSKTTGIKLTDDKMGLVSFLNQRTTLNITTNTGPACAVGANGTWRWGKLQGISFQFAVAPTGGQNLASGLEVLGVAAWGSIRDCSFIKTFRGIRLDPAYITNPLANFFSMTVDNVQIVDVYDGFITLNPVASANTGCNFGNIYCNGNDWNLGSKKTLHGIPFTFEATNDGVFNQLNAEHYFVGGNAQMALGNLVQANIKINSLHTEDIDVSGITGIASCWTLSSTSNTATSNLNIDEWTFTSWNAPSGGTLTFFFLVDFITSYNIVDIRGLIQGFSNTFGASNWKTNWTGGNTTYVLNEIYIRSGSHPALSADQASSTPGDGINILKTINSDPYYTCQNLGSFSGGTTCTIIVGNNTPEFIFTVTSATVTLVLFGHFGNTQFCRTLLKIIGGGDNLGNVAVPAGTLFVHANNVTDTNKPTYSSDPSGDYYEIWTETGSTNAWRFRLLRGAA